MQVIEAKDVYKAATRKATKLRNALRRLRKVWPPNDEIKASKKKLQQDVRIAHIQARNAKRAAEKDCRRIADEMMAEGLRSQQNQDAKTCKAKRPAGNTRHSQDSKIYMPKEPVHQAILLLLMAFAIASLTLMLGINMVEPKGGLEVQLHALYIHQKVYMRALHLLSIELLHRSKNGMLLL